jgi:hypothetical protein
MTTGMRPATCSTTTAGVDRPDDAVGAAFDAKVDHATQSVPIDGELFVKGG